MTVAVRGTEINRTIYKITVRSFPHNPLNIAFKVTVNILNATVK